MVNDKSIDSYEVVGVAEDMANGNKEMVDAFKAKINYRLKEHKYVHISDEFNDLYNYKIECSSDRKDEEVKKLTKKLSSFMAYQEALHSLML